MERKLLKKLNYKLLLVSVAIMTFGFMEAQTISTPVVSENPLVATFTLTNGGGQDTNNKFQIGTEYNYILMPGNISFGNFSIQNPPGLPNASANFTRQIYAPLGTQGGDYTIEVNSSNPSSTSGESNEFELFNDFEIDDQAYTGYVQCQTPAVSYRLVTITNTGNIIDKYNLSLDQILVLPTTQELGFELIDIDENTIVETPNLFPNESFTFMILISAINGTQPNKDNFTNLIIISNNENEVREIEIHTKTYCGNGNNIPGNPDSPDLAISKTANTPNAIVDEVFTYTLLVSHKRGARAQTPTVTDVIPDNLKVVNYYLQQPSGQPDANDIFLSYDEGSRLFQAIYPTNNQRMFEPGNLIIIKIDVRPNCFATPSVVNTAEVYNFAGDPYESDNIASVTTNINFDTSNPTELGIWQGSFSDNWFDCRNWSKGLVPDSTIDVTIPPNTAPNHQPNIDDTDIALARSLTIQGGATLSMETNALLEIHGNWTNNDTFNHGNGTVAFVGSIDQQIVDISGRPTFFNLKINTTNDSKVQIIDDQGLFVTNQLNLESGVLRLEGLSQLIQPDGATVIATNGKLWRDQQGHANMYNYNYWSSPVGNGLDVYTLASVMQDGTNQVPQDITWVGGYNGAPTTPISISTTWLHKFESTGPLYANWQKIMPGTTLNAGQGYTMKGSGAVGDFQNYTFVGVPFTGDISHTISDGQITLLGNPYASALDADQFIDDNIGVIDGTLEFWDHFETTNSHVLAMYKGGYAKYNKVGETIEAVNAVNNDSVQSSRTPQRYIPVGQGFFVSAREDITIQNDSPIIFKNSQRAFVRENDTDGMQMFGIPDGTNSNTGAFEEPVRIRLNMVSAENYRHQIAIGFMQDKATEGIDYGYDAILRKTDPNQFYFMHPDAKLLIQGVGYFNEDKKYPLGVMAELQGRYTFSVDHIENLSENTAVYLYDNEKQIYHNLRKSDYLVNLAKGEHNTRFSLRFKNHNIESNLNAQEMLNNIVVYRQNDQVVIYNPTEQLTVKSARMYNVLGQEVNSWNISNGRESYIELPLKPLAAGIYVVQIQTDNGAVSKKINIR